MFEYFASLYLDIKKKINKESCIEAFLKDIIRIKKNINIKTIWALRV